MIHASLDDEVTMASGSVGDSVDDSVDDQVDNLLRATTNPVMVEVASLESDNVIDDTNTILVN
jgi:hypothetical protein